MAQPANYLSAMGILPDPVGAINQSLMMDSRLRAAGQAEQINALKLRQAEQEIGEASAFRRDVDGLLANPSPEAYSALFAKYPAFQKALSSSWDTRNEAARDNDLREMASIYAAGEAGQWGVVSRSLKKRIEADKAAGQDTTEDEEALRIAESGTPEERRALLGMTGVSLAATLGPQKFTEAYKVLNPNQAREGKVVGQSLVDPVTGEVIYQAPTDPKYMNVGGSLVEIPGSDGMSRGGQSARANSYFDKNDVVYDGDVFDSIVRQESGGRQFGEDGKPLRSPKGAVGIAQIMPGTGPEAARLAGLDWDIKRLHTDPEYNAALGKAYFGKQMSDFGDPALAAAAYNAGPARVKAALRKGGDDGWINHVPRETRDYVANVIPARSGGSPRVLFSAPEKPKDAPSGYRWTGDGSLEPIPGGPAASASLTPGQRAVDSAFAKEYVDFNAAGGLSDVEKNVGQLEEAIANLKAGGITGPVVGRMPDAVLSVTNPKTIETRNAVEEVVQRNLRLILGAQFTEREGERLIARAFNPVLSDAENLKRVERLRTQIVNAAKTKADASRYFEQYGTLQGWKGKMPNLNDFNPEGVGGAPVRVSSSDDYAKLPSGAQYIDPQGNLRTKR